MINNASLHSRQNPISKSEPHSPQVNRFSFAHWLCKVRYFFITLWHWIFSNIDVGKQTFNVLDFMWVHKIDAAAIGPDHPWSNGLIPGTSTPIWPKNIVFASPRKSKWIGLAPASDDEIVSRIGRFLMSMVNRSNISNPEIPQGKKRRMPHAVNYIHGSVHYNGGFVLFNDFKDVMVHLSDPKFIHEIYRFGKKERRELTLIIRERSYDPEEYAWLVCFVRAHLKWYANGNGPTKKRVLHGTPSPYPAINPINGNWVGDMHRLYQGKIQEIIRKPIEAKYFQHVYSGNQSEFTFMERFHAWGQYLITYFKGFQGGLVFTKRTKIEPENWKLYKETNGQWRPGYAISHPFMSLARARSLRIPESTG